MIIPDIELRTAPLPEDILRLKMAGYYNEEKRLIEKRLDSDIPECIKERLRFELDVIDTLPLDYPFTYEEALAESRKVCPDLTEEEFADLKDSGKIEWIYNEGEVRYFESVANNVARAMSRKSNPHPAEITSPDENDSRSQIIYKMYENQDREIGVSLGVRATMRIKDKYFTPGKVTVHLPFPALNERIPQYTDIKLKDTSYADRITVAPEFAPQRTVCLEKYMTASEPFYIEYTYRSALKIVDPYKVINGEYINTGRPLYSPDELKPFLSEKAPQILFTPFLRKLAAEITAGENEPIKKARKIYDFITTKMDYSYMRAYNNLDNIPEYFALRGLGDCGVQELLFITLCRISGIPAQWQSGLSAKPDYVGAHDWGMFYCEPYGWLHNDCSVGGGYYRSGRLKEWDFFFCNIDPYRMIANNEICADFIPPKKYPRNDIYDSQSGEAEYENRPIPNYMLSWTRTPVKP